MIAMAKGGPLILMNHSASVCEKPRLTPGRRATRADKRAPLRYR